MAEFVLLRAQGQPLAPSVASHSSVLPRLFTTTTITSARLPGGGLAQTHTLRHAGRKTTQVRTALRRPAPNTYTGRIITVTETSLLVPILPGSAPDYSMGTEG